VNTINRFVFSFRSKLIALLPRSVGDKLANCSDFKKKLNRKRNSATSLTYYFSTRILLHTVHTDSSIIWLLVASATVNDQSVYLCIMYQMTSNNYKNTGAPKCLKMGHVTPTNSPYYQYPTPSKFRVTWFEPFPTNKGSYCSIAASVARHGHRNRSGRPGGCRTNNLTKNFSVHIISTFVNVKQVEKCIHSGQLILRKISKYDATRVRF